MVVRNHCVAHRQALETPISSLATRWFPIQPIAVMFASSILSFDLRCCGCCCMICLVFFVTSAAVRTDPLSWFYACKTEPESFFRQTQRLSRTRASRISRVFRTLHTQTARDRIRTRDGKGCKYFIRSIKFTDAHCHTYTFAHLLFTTDTFVCCELQLDVHANMRAFTYLRMMQVQNMLHYEWACIVSERTNVCIWSCYL